MLLLIYVDEIILADPLSINYKIIRLLVVSQLRILVNFPTFLVLKHQLRTSTGLFLS